MSDPIVSRIQSIEARIKEIESLGRKAPKNTETPKAAQTTNAESFSQIMKEIGNTQLLDGFTSTDPQDLMQNRIDSTNILTDALKSALKTNAVNSPDKSSRVNFNDIVLQAAKNHGVDPNLVHAIISAESNYNPLAVSSKGAQGLMQLMPATARDLGVSDSFDPTQNIDGGTRYIKELLTRYKGDLVRALAAYNSGPAAVDKAGGIPNFAETQLYVPKVLKTYYNLNQEG